MWSDLLARFVIGGLTVSLFSLIGDLFKPKSFAGLFSAAPSVALATLWLAIIKYGSSYAAIEGRSMMAGALALYVYSQIVALILIRYKLSSAVVSLSMLAVWCLPHLVCRFKATNENQY
jgi:hypothetical protein